MNINNFFGKTTQMIKKNTPGILTGIGIISMGMTVACAIKATPKAHELIKEQEKKEKRELTNKEVIKLVGKEYVKAAAFGSISIACFVSSLAINSKRNALLATALTLSETTLKEYIQNTIKTVGAKTEKKIRDSISEDKAKKSFEDNKAIIITNKGNTLFIDALTGKDFRSDIDVVKKSIHELNSEIINYNYVSLNDYCFKLFKENVALGDILGWNVNGGLIDIYFSAQMRGDEAAIVINHENMPINEFDRMY